MERTKLVLSSVVGVAAIAVTAFASAQNRTLPDPSPVPRSYLCFEGHSASEVTRKANEAGTRGWRLIAASPGASGSIWCFEQLRAGRPGEPDG